MSASKDQHNHTQKREAASKLSHQAPNRNLKMPSRSQYLGLDCEMVGDLKGESMAARVVLVNWFGMIIFDEYVKPDVQVTDYRTYVSGITKNDLLEKGQPIHKVRSKVQSLIHDKIVVGHGLPNDLACLGIKHPWYLQRDTAYYEPLMQKRSQKHPYGNSSPDMLLMPRKLRELAMEKLSRAIQVPGRPHCPAEDAIAALDLYKMYMDQWESFLQAQFFQMVRQRELHCQQIQHQLRLQQLQRMALQEQYVQFLGYPQCLPGAPHQTPHYQPSPPPRGRRRQNNAVPNSRRPRTMRSVAPQPVIHA